MTKPITRICIDCSSRLKNRSKSTLRCRECRFKYIQSIAKGRTTGNCNKCNVKLTIKNNKTGTCIKCMDRSKIIRKKSNKPAWNKGLSIFKDADHKATHAKEIRRKLRASQPKEKNIADRIRTLIRIQLKRMSFTKPCKSEEIVGCTMIEYRKYIESKFEKWMNWENYGNGEGQWNIDHIIPVSLFDLSDETELKKAFNYKNTRPLSAKENFSKGNRITATVTFGYTH